MALTSQIWQVRERTLKLLRRHSCRPAPVLQFEFWSFSGAWCLMLGVSPFRPHLPHRIKLWRQNTNQQLLPTPRRFLAPAFIPLNPPRLMQQPYNPSRHPFRIRHPIRRQSLPQIPRFAHVQHPLTGPAHQIHSRPFRQCPKEFVSEPLHQRPRRFKQPKLTRSHSFTF